MEIGSWDGSNMMENGPLGSAILEAHCIKVVITGGVARQRLRVAMCQLGALAEA